jgi:hypothetical protein
MFENYVYGTTVSNQKDVFEEIKRRLNLKIFVIHYVRFNIYVYKTTTFPFVLCNVVSFREWHK